MPVDAEMIIPVFVALVGLAFGSFATLVSYRLPHESSIVFTRSQCPSCKHPLDALDLFPVISWLAHGGACRHCKAAVSIRYPLTELATMALFLLVYEQMGISVASVLCALLAVCIVILTVTDLEHQIIPDQIQWAMAVLAILWHALTPAGNLWDAGIGLLAGGGFGWALQNGYKLLRKRDGLGTGDVKFLAVAGLWLGPLGLVPLFLYSGILGIITALIWRMLGKGPIFPFGPALAFSMFLMVVFPEFQDYFWEPKLWLR